MFDITDFQLCDASQVLTPCLLAYPRRIQANIAESIRIAGAADRLRPHVKTHKTPQIVRMALEAGIMKHKCATLSEARMLAECEVPDVLLAYPQVGPSIEYLAELVVGFPKTRFSTLVENTFSLELLDSAMERDNQRLDVLLDIDTGMHRTGIPCGEAAVELYRRIASSRSLQPVGFHVYDGQNHQPDLGERRTAVHDLLQPVLEMVALLKNSSTPVTRLVCGGTPTFPVFAAIDLTDRDLQIECSPGTSVLSDFNYGRDYSDMSRIHPAAILMTRVISQQHPDHVTLDLGYKAVASDPPAGRRCHFLNLPEAQEVQHSEEHLVVRSPHAHQLTVGDVLYVVPAHICPTVALHSHLLVVEQGQIIDRWHVQARDRHYGLPQPARSSV